MQVCREMGIVEVSLRYYGNKERIKMAPEYVKLREERENKKFRADDLFPDGVLMEVKPLCNSENSIRKEFI